MAVHVLSKVEALFDPANPWQTECSLQSVARERWGRNSECVAATIPFQALFLVVDGQAVFSTRGREYRVGKGNVFCCGPGVDHRIWCDESNELDILLIRFCGYSARQLMIESIGDTNLVCKPSNPLAIQMLLENMIGIAQSKVPLSEEICSQYVRIVLLTIKSGLVPANNFSSKAYASFDSCRRYIDHRFESMTSAQEAAQACKLEHAYMCRLFRRFLGTSPQAYWLRLKMNQAAHLLQTTDLSIKKIARTFQFSDSHSFSKAFKRLFGVAPDSYRSSFSIATRSSESQS